MTDIERKALALLKKCVGNAIWKHPITRINRQTNLEHEALCRAIEQHEAAEQIAENANCSNCEATKQELSDFRQEVSDELITRGFINAPIGMGRFIIPAPKPDPLVEAMKKAGWADAVIASCAPSLSAALDAAGLEIREKNDGQ